MIVIRRALDQRAARPRAAWPGGSRARARDAIFCPMAVKPSGGSSVSGGMRSSGMAVLWALSGSFVGLLPGTAARAQEGLVATEPGSDDPIGTDRTSDLARIPVIDPPIPAAALTERGPRPPGVTSHAGAVLTAISAVREVDHVVDITLDEGLALVDVNMRFANGARHPAEIRYRLAVPEGAALSGLRVCATSCREGLAEDGAGVLSVYDDAVRSRGEIGAAPVAHARPIRDAQGNAFMVRAAPVPPGGALDLTVRYVAEAPLRGGVARFSLPPRGMDPRAAPAVVHASSPSLLGTTVDGSVPSEAGITLDPWLAIEVSARAPTGASPAAEVQRFRCGDQTCARVRAAAGPAASGPVDLTILVDASPSTRGPARGRIAPAIASLLSVAPAGTRVRAIAFGATAQHVIESPTPVSEVPLLPLAQAVGLGLGAATRFEAAWAAASSDQREARSPRLRRLMVIVGDGGLSGGDESARAFAEARRAGVEVSTVNVADRETWPALRAGIAQTGGVVIDAGEEADAAARGRETAPLEERLVALFAPVVARQVVVRAGSQALRLGSLRAGEQLAWVGVVRNGAERIRVAGVGAVATPAAERSWAGGLGVLAAAELGLSEPRAVLAAVDPRDLGAAHGPRCDALGPARRASGVSSDERPVALAEERTCTPPSETASRGGDAGRGMPAETVLGMLRERVIPVARRCFRLDRAGRGDYAARATFVLEMADQELVTADVRGVMTAELRACLFEAVHAVAVPMFDGTVRVRYPVFTERDAPPPVVELAPDVARQVDRVSGP